MLGACEMNEKYQYRIKYMGDNLRYYNFLICVRMSGVEIDLGTQNIHMGIRIMFSE